MMAPSGRDLEEARRAAREGLELYANLLRRWNAPDDEHTIYTLRGMVEDIIDAEFHS